MSRFYVMTMLALPLLELWDRWMARITVPLDYCQSFSIDRWVVTMAGLCGGRGHPEHYSRVWVFRVPWMRTWDYHINSQDFGWCIIFVVHATGHGWKVLHVPAPGHYEPRPPWRGV